MVSLRWKTLWRKLFGKVDLKSFLTMLIAIKLALAHLDSWLVGVIPLLSFLVSIGMIGLCICLYPSQYFWHVRIDVRAFHPSSMYTTVYYNQGKNPCLQNLYRFRV